MNKQYDEMYAKHKELSKESEVLRRHSREKEKLVKFLEKEVRRRNEEIESLVSNQLSGT